MLPKKIKCPSGRYRSKKAKEALEDVLHEAINALKAEKLLKVTKAMKTTKPMKAMTATKAIGAKKAMRATKAMKTQNAMKANRNVESAVGAGPQVAKK